MFVRAITGVLVLSTMVAAQLPDLAFDAVVDHPFGLTDGVEYIAIADLTGDGLADVVARDLVHLADGLGAYVPVAPGVARLATPFRSAVGDLDGDGDLDVVDDVGVNLNDGNGGFTAGAAIVLPASPCGPIQQLFSPVLVDLDLDGDLDVFAIEGFSCNPIFSAHLILNDGSANLAAPPAPLTFFANPPTFNEATDIDGDGDPDIVVATATSVLAFFNDGAGAFTPAGSLGNFGQSGGAALGVKGDWDGNGIDGFAFWSPGVITPDGPLEIASGFGTLQTVASYVELFDLAAVDLDGDGIDEILVLAGKGLDVIDLSGPMPVTTTIPFKDTTGTGRIIIGDLDHDGLDDVLVDVDARPLVFLGDGLGGLEELSRHDGAAARTVPGAVADFDGDGDIDQLMREDIDVGGGVIQSVITVLANDGTGRFAPDPATFSVLPVEAGDVAHVFDANADGRPDVYLGSGDSGTAASVLLLNAAPGFTAATIHVSANEVVRIEHADFDGDGDPDLLLGRGATTAATTDIALNQGGGVFTSPAPIGSPPNCVQGMAVGDVDGDGDVDLMLACVAVPQIYLNDGTGTFAAGPFFFSFPAFGCSFGDLDGDGDLDAFVGPEFWENDGSGSFSSRGTTPFLPLANHIEDVDGDGDGDIVDINGAIFENTGSFTFTRHTLLAWRALGKATPYPVFVDIDQDGDRDVIVDGHIHRNVTRHLAGRGDRALGSNEQLDIYVTAPGQITWLYASLATADIALAPFGRLFLDPTSSELVVAGPIPPSGVATVALPIPANPLLAGLDVFFQAVLTDGLSTHLTNLHAVRIRP